MLKLKTALLWGKQSNQTTILFCVLEDTPEPDLQTEEDKSGMPREAEEQNHRALDQQ